MHSLPGRRRADRAEERPQRHLDLADLAVRQVEDADVALGIQAPDEQLVRHRVGDHRGLVLGRERAEVRDRRAPAEVPVQADVVDVDDQRVAGLGALDVERPGLRVDRRQVELGHHGLVAGREHVVGRVPGAGLHGVAGIDAQRRRMGVAVGEVDGVARVVFDFGRERGRAQRDGQASGQDRQAAGRRCRTDLRSLSRDLPRSSVMVAPHAASRSVSRASAQRIGVSSFCSASPVRPSPS